MPPVRASYEDRQLRPRDNVGMGGDVMRAGLREPPTFRPTKVEMADFAAYVSKIYKEAADYGICKVVPPKGWQGPQKQPPAGNFLLRDAILQHAVGSHGVYTLMHQTRKQAISFDQFVKQAESYAAREHVAKDASLDALEDKFWSELIGARPPLYGADLDASLFSPELSEWNLNLLNDMLRMGSGRLKQKMAGINTPMLYLGAFRTIFSLCARARCSHSACACTRARALVGLLCLPHALPAWMRKSTD